MSHKKKKNNNEQQEFEFCEVCRLNHNQGRRHNYFLAHKTSLSTLLTRFQSKLADVKFFVKTPMFISPDHAHRNLLWCVFCNCDILELDSPFACGKSIQHLASMEHWKRVKGFMWKYGGGMDRVDLFRIAEVDYAKWEKKCTTLKTEAAKAESIGPLIGPSKRMREHRYPTQYHLSRRLILLHTICLGTYIIRSTQQVTWIISTAPILLLGNAHLMVIPVMNLSVGASKILAYSGMRSYLARPIEEVKTATYEERNRAYKCAEKLQSNLQTGNPSFVKSIRRT